MESEDLMPPKAPRSLLGRYRLLKKLGIGGMGTVYLAEDTDNGRQVALKIPRFEGKEGSPVLERFEREACIAKGIEHPHLCPVYDYGQIEGQPYLTMPYIEGTALSRMLNTRGPWPPVQALSLVRTLAVALQVVHDKGVVHRDLKPSNIIIRANGEPMIMDFGLARSYTEAAKQLTSTGVALGTPAYMAPEQILEGGTIGPSSDMYSLGVMLYELVAGRLPFEGSPTALFGQILHATPPPPSKHQPDLDARLDAVCLRALAKKPTDRFATMTEFAEALEAEIAELEPPEEEGQGAPSRPVPVVRVICPACGKKLRVPPEAEGRVLACPKCGTAIVTEEASWLQRPLFRLAGVLALLLLVGMAVALVLKEQLAFAACWVALIVLGGVVLGLARRSGEDEGDADTPAELASVRPADNPNPSDEKLEPQSDDVEQAAPSKGQTPSN